MKNKVIFFALLVLAAILRFYKLGDIPPTLHADEASFVLNSVSIMESGRDEDNRVLPIYLYSIKDFKPALYSYLQIPFFLSFGVSAFASRIPAVLFGLGSIILFYLLMREVFENNQIAVISVALLTISPWHIVISRATQEVIMAFFFGVWSLLIFVKLFKKFQSSHSISIWLYVQLFIANILSMYSYHSYKIFLPAIYSLLLIYLFIRCKKTKQDWLFLISVFLSFAIPFGVTFASAMVRFSSIGILNDDLPKAMIFEYTTRATGKTPIWFLRAFYNKPVFYFKYFLQNYFSHFSGNYLFLEGGKTARYIVPAQGWLHLVDIPIFFVGVYLLIQKKKQIFLKLLLALILISAPIAASLTTEDIPSSDRPFQMLIFFIIVISIGIINLLKIKKTSIRTGLFLLLSFGYIWGLGHFINQYFILMPKYKQWHRSRDYELLAEAIVQEKEKYENVRVSNDLRELYIYLWLQGAINISDIRDKPFARHEQEYEIDNYIFNRNQCDFSQASSNDLLAGTNDCLITSKQDLKLIKETYFDPETPAHSLYQLSSQR